jgi:hypothetical protein
MHRRHFLLLAGVSTLAIAAYPYLARSSQPVPVLSAHDSEVVDRGLVEDALDVVWRLWDFPPVQAEAFGYQPWTIWSSGELSELVEKVALKDEDPMMWDRILLWIQLGHALDRKFGRGNVSRMHDWMNTREPLPTYNVKFYVLTGSPANLHAALRFLEAA